jgi:hypothetical protein
MGNKTGSRCALIAGGTPALPVGVASRCYDFETSLPYYEACKNCSDQSRPDQALEFMKRVRIDVINQGRIRH